jgi:hypothetical protein
VLDENNDAVGKIGQLRVLKAVGTRPDIDNELEKLKSFHFSGEYIANQRERLRLRGPF